MNELPEYSSEEVECDAGLCDDDGGKVKRVHLSHQRLLCCHHRCLSLNRLFLNGTESPHQAEEEGGPSQVARMRTACAAFVGSILLKRIERKGPVALQRRHRLRGQTSLGGRGGFQEEVLSVEKRSHWTSEDLLS